jgi:hypothetical protein
MNSTEINFQSFSIFYSHIHGWLSITICTLGIIFNTFNVIILKKIKLTLELVNVLLILIALTNSITMISYLPYCLHYYVLYDNPIYTESDPSRDTLFWTLYEILSTMICSTTHLISIWLTVYLSIYRFFNLLQSLNMIRKQSIFEKKIIKFILLNNKLILIMIISFCILCCIPTYLYPKCNKYKLKQNTTLSIIYYITESDLNIETNNLIFKASFYLQAIVGKIIPCSLLGMFIGLISHYLNLIKNNKKNFLRLNSLKENNKSKNSSNHKRRINNECKHKNIMLSSVCLLLFIAELPQAFLLLCSIFSDYIYLSFYKPLGDLLDILVLITYPINFFIYCSMSKSFRKEFCLLFKF